jgi:hypothetical protein
MSKRKRAEAFVGKKIKDPLYGREGVVEAVVIDKAYCRDAKGVPVYKDTLCFRLRVSDTMTVIQKVNARVRYKILT